MQTFLFVALHILGAFAPNPVFKPAIETMFAKNGVGPKKYEGNAFFISRLMVHAKANQAQIFLGIDSVDRLTTEWTPVHLIFYHRDVHEISL